MSWESDFEKFKKSLLSKYRKKCEEKIKEAEKIYFEKIKKAEEKGKMLYEREIKEFAEDLELKKREILTEIKQNYQIKLNSILSGIKKDVMTALEEKINQDFEEFVKCFSQWLQKKFPEGEIKTPARYSSFFSRYKVTIWEKNEIFFRKGMIEISFSPQEIINSYEKKITFLLKKELQV